MKTFALTTLLGLASAAATAQQKANWADHKVVRVANTPEAQQWIKQLNLPTWVKTAENLDVVVPPGVNVLDGVKTVTMHSNLGKSIAEEGQYQIYAAGSANQTWFNSYHAYADHVQFLTDLSSSYKSQSEIVQIGNSLQGRPITGIHLWGSGGKNSKPAVVIHGTVHAREWIGTMVVEYLAYNLLNNYANDTSIKSLVDKYDLYFLPVVNPDGFVYTQTTNRLWRKNRQTTSGSTCLGHDINRNWPYKWSVSGGASTDPCAEDFKGVTQGDAPENKVLSAHVNSLASSANGVALYIDYHSYSQLVMSPYGYSCSAVPTNSAKYNSLTSGWAAAIKAVYGTTFQSGPICSTIYQATGTSVDYVSDVSKARYSFTSELRDTGNYGFVLPANQIRPSGVEAFAGFKYLLQNI